MASNQAQSDRSGDAAAAVRGRTMADEEVDRLERKAARGDVLDPIALNDPLGQSVERVILRIGITVVAILITGLLLAQVACKNIRLASIPDLSSGVTEGVVESALSNGISWAGDIVRFPSTKSTEVTGNQAVVTSTDTSSRSLELAVSAAISRSTALAVNAFRDPAIDRLVYIVDTHVTEAGAAFSTRSSDPVEEAFRVVWTRTGDDAQMTMRLEGTVLSELLDTESNKVDETPGVQLGE